MRQRYFLDTSYLLALELRNDQNHEHAQRHWQTFRQNLPYFVTTSYVFDEVVTFFNSRHYHAKAVSVGTRLLTSAKVTLAHIDEELFYQGWRYFVRHEDKQYSLTDCISFIVMNQYQLTTAFTFDHHFTQAGYMLEPGD
ncbi:PIN domain-containing protein [Candidatus Chloroploca sp. M-50]|uniref:PIN domain-containing protein n=1 Tax=Candidatus Chloroploca mongolica TaxID=2528176 RepID=A0ABS4DFH1_9CHLR|nr:PIN domain-containing protein [Candidatus Chloroploca mongolica]MBP1468199.1 PIN domain-containing protein [Candidatus Chloroploca mongolica]